MSSKIIASTSSGTALNMSADTSGILEIQTGATPTTAITVDTAQNVGIGTSSPTSKLDLAGGNLTISNSSNAPFVNFVDNTTRIQSLSRITMDQVSGTAGQLLFSTTTGGTLSERMRITSTGQLMVNTTSITGSPDQMQLYPSTTGSFQYGFMIGGNGTGYTVNAMRFVNTYTPAVVGTIVIGSSSTAYNTSSDYRLKEDIAPMTGALNTVSALKPVTYKWKLDGKDGQGFIAHELAEVMPEAVTGEKDAVETVDDLDEDGKVIGTKEVPVYQGIDTSFLVATLTAAIQELKAEVDALKAAK